MDHDLIIPIKPYLKKYLAKQKIIHPDGYIQVSSTHIIGVLLLKMLEKKKTYIYNRLYDFSKHDSIYIRLNKLIVKNRIGDSLQSENIYFFNKAVHELLMRDLDMYISTRSELCDEFAMTVELELKRYASLEKIINKKSEMYLAIEYFLSKFEITEKDLTFETLVKSYYRYRMD